MAKKKIEVLEKFNHTEQEKLALELNNLYQDMIQSLGSCLETGSHHLNNLAAEEFYKKYKWFVDDMNKLGEKIREIMPENY